jgi:hypothetical protein
VRLFAKITTIKPELTPKRSAARGGPSCNVATAAKPHLERMPQASRKPPFATHHARCSSFPPFFSFLFYFSPQPLAEGMCLRQFLGRLPVWRKARTSPAPTVKRSDSEKKSERGQESPAIHPETIQTASNVLYFALRTLSSISSHIPLGGVLSGIIEPLLDITGRIQVS